MGSYRVCMVRDWGVTHVTAAADTVRLITEDRKNVLFWMPQDWDSPTWWRQGDPIARSNATNVISRGIWASQKLSRGFLLDLSKVQDPRTLGYLPIFGLYLKPIAYC